MEPVWKDLGRRLERKLGGESVLILVQQTLFNVLFLNFSKLKSVCPHSLWEKLGASHEKKEEHQKRSTPVSHKEKIRDVGSKGSVVAKETIARESDVDSLERRSR